MNNLISTHSENNFHSIKAILLRSRRKVVILPCRAVIPSRSLRTHLWGLSKDKLRDAIPSTLFHNSHFPLLLPFLFFWWLLSFFITLSPLIKARNPSWFLGKITITNLNFSCEIHSVFSFVLPRNYFSSVLVLGIEVHCPGPLALPKYP